MFVYYFVQVQGPFESVEKLLNRRLDLLGEFADAAYREGEELRDRIGLGNEHRVVAKTVRLVTGKPLRGELQTTIPFAWEATGSAGLFLRLEADLIVAPVGPDLCQIALRGTYSPPLHPLRGALDRALFHRVAEASVKSFVDRVAASLERDEDTAAA